MSNEDIQHLKDLKKLLDEGILTQEEFNSAKRKFLSDGAPARVFNNVEILITNQLLKNKHLFATIIFKYF